MFVPLDLAHERLHRRVLVGLRFLLLYLLLCLKVDLVGGAQVVVLLKLIKGVCVGVLRTHWDFSDGLLVAVKVLEITVFAGLIKHFN